MEYLRDENINKVDSVTETSEEKTTMVSEAEAESRLAVELETPEAWTDNKDRSSLKADNQDRSDKKTNGKRLIWLHVIGE